MWNDENPRRELRGHEVAMGRSSSEVVVLDDRVIEAANRAQPGVTNINVTRSSRLHIGPKFVSVTQNVDNTEVVKGRILGLELVSPQNSKRLRCSIAVFVCWAFVVASGLIFLILHFALATHPTRLDLDLPLPRYLWDIAKSTTKAERLSCAAAIIALLVCIILIVYFNIAANRNADSIVDVAPHEWFITRDMWLAPPFLHPESTTEFSPLKLVIIAHTVGSECTVFQNCAAEMRSLQSYFVANYEYDAPYNFAIGNEGRVYELRGWNRTGAHSLSYNRCSLGVGFIGDYRDGASFSKVTDLQLLRAQMLFKEGVKLGFLHKDFRVVGQKDVISSESPGGNLYRAIQQWHNYDHERKFIDQTCEFIHGVQPTTTTQMATLPPTFNSLTAAPHEWFITREMWLAPPFINQNVTTEFSPLKLVIITETISNECTEFTTCAAELRALQSYFVKNYEYDMPYNFLIGNEGRVYEGRGWNRVGAHTFRYNSCTLSIAFIGDYREGLPSHSNVTELQLARAKMLLAEGVKRGYLQSDYHVVGQKDVISTLSPGANLYREIQKWKNYNTQYAGKSCEAIHAAPHEWFITREMWLAPPFINQNVTTEFSPLKLVIITETISNECTEFTTCAAELRALQSYFVKNYEYDMPYNFLIGNEGRVYEGRGWNRVGAHTVGYNSCTLSIAFIGDYREGLPSHSNVTELQLVRAKMLLAEGVKRGYLQSDYHVVGQKDVISTWSPGANLYREIQKWKNYNTQYAGKSCEAIHAAPHEWFITREMWLAPPFINQNVTTEFSPLKLVIITETIGNECTEFTTCAAELRALQSYFVKNYEYDMPYNFLIGNEGRVYEGRGWNRVGAHTVGYNSCTLSIAFIGDYREGLPSHSNVTELQLVRAKMLLAEGVKRGYLQSDYHVVGQKDVISTLSPGANLYREIQKWKNYNTQYAGKSCEAIHAAPHEWFITREMWLAPPFINQNVTTEFSPLKLVIITETIGNECTEFTTCAAELRALQSYFVKNYEYDMPYNFLIGNEGRVYEGRGWNRVGAHTVGYNSCTLSIAFIGDYREGLPSHSNVTELQLVRAKMLLAEGVKRGYLQSDYHVVGQKDVISTLSPGANLYREIQKWKNYNTQYAGKSCEAIHAAPHEWFITREMWLAPPFINQNVTTEFSPLKLVIITETIGNECTEFTTCAAELRALQSYFVKNYEYDMPYNFLIGNEGRVYEGRGWNRVGAHTVGYNSCTLSIAFIGDYREGLPSHSNVTELQLVRAKMLLAEGVKRGYLQSDYHVVGQKDVISTLSPGANLYREIQKWKNYNTQYAGKSCEAIHAAPHEWFITREMWLAPPFINQNVTTEFSPLKLVIITETIGNECTEFTTCAAELRALQSYFVKNYEYDMPYNFLIGNEGRVYEGRGWNRVGAHTVGYNSCTLSIAFIGDYREGLPSHSNVTELQLVRAKMLLAEGVKRGYLQSDYHVVGQKDVISTLSPGANLYREIQKWKNYNTQYAGKSCEAIHAAPHEWFITREMWLAPPFINQNVTTEFSPLKLVIITETIGNECTEFTTCAAELRALQSYFVKNYEYDMPYNFLIGNEGRVYEGRGWNRVGAHTVGYNSCTLSIAFIGDYREGLPSHSNVTELQLVRAKMLLAEGVKRGYLQSDYHVVGQKDVISTLSPGANLYREIQKWKNYNTQYAGKSCEAIHAAPHEWFITREMWLAPPFINQNVTTEFSPLKLVIITETIGNECTEFTTCAAELRALQSYFVKNYEYDMPYNFLIGNEGRVYEGRGWNRVGAHTVGYNSCTLSIAFIGDYREGLPSHSNVTELQLVRAKMLLAEGVKRGYLQSDYHVVGQKDVISTLSPGANLYREIQKWKNYNTQYAGKSCEAIHAAPHEWFITREMWLAPPFINQNVTTEFSPLKLVIITETISNECTEFTTCAAELRALQSYFVKNYEYDMPYNFLIGNEGRVYEGRGWNRVGAHTVGYNSCTLSIAFIGDYRKGLPSHSNVTELQLTRAKMLLAEGVKRGYLQSDYHVVGQKDVITTMNPGANLYREIQKWKNYNTLYAGKSCEAIHGVNQTSVAAQMDTAQPTFKNPTSYQSSDT